LFVEEIFATRISSFFAADLILSSVIFLGWSRREAREKKIEGWWLVLLSNLVVGLSLALPLYLLKRLDSAKTAIAQEALHALAARPAIDRVRAADDRNYNHDDY
jgi:hypothetical protein